MNYLRIAICEDNSKEQEHLLNIIDKLHLPVKITLFNSGEEFLLDYRVGKFDIIFMDIYMKNLSGIETITKIREIDQDISIAFTTSSTDHTLESYRLDALKYIEKPAKEKPVKDLLELVMLKKDKIPELKVKVKRKDITIPFDSIIYIEQKSHKLFLYLIDKQVLEVNDKLDNIESEFDDNFFRCHKSYLVNFTHVKNLNRDLMVFVMKNNSNVHIRRESIPLARKHFEEYLLKMSKSIINL